MSIITDVTTIDTNNYAGMAKAMGMATEAVGSDKKTNTLARLKIQHAPMMGEMEIEGKSVKVETINGGVYKLEVPDEETYYCDKVTVRPFLQRFMYKRFITNPNPKDGESRGSYQKTVMADNLNIDLKDNHGNFNCGKPAGYIKDFTALPKDMQDLIKQIKRVRVVFGTIDMVDAMTSDKQSRDIISTPFIWEIDNRDAFKIIGEPFTKLAKVRKLPIQHTFELGTEEKKIPTGNSFYLPTVNVDATKSITLIEKDQDMFADFMAWVQNYNEYITGEWQKKASSTMTDEQMEVVETFVDIE
tara:strand:+ start:473 stop:1375 length:903 start_codon:yes stop_codon:yes gene_type:complete